MHGSILSAEERQRDVLGENLIRLCESPQVLQILIDCPDQLTLLPFIQIFIGGVVKSLSGGREACCESDTLIGGVLHLLFLSVSLYILICPRDDDLF